MKFRTAGLGLVLSTATLAHAVDDAAFARCRGIADTVARLACYDGLPMGPASAGSQASPIAPSRPAAGAPAPSTTAPAASARAAPAPSAAPAPAAPQAQAAQNFGLEERVAAAQEVTTTMESTIPGRFEGWGPNARIKLANGQVWQVVDGSSAVLYRDNPKVVVRRGMMGGFFLEIENSNRSPRVRRIQ
jgi:hypothetical protein